MKRIAIVGSGGAGKSTLSCKLSEILKIPVYHLDIFFWKPGWEMTDMIQWHEINEELINKDYWIIDGNFKSTMAERIKASDMIIFLDISRIRCLVNAWKRFFKYMNKRRADLAQGCFEKIDFQYYKWIWGYRKRSKPYTMQYINTYGKGKETFILKSGKEIKIFIENLEKNSAFAETS